MTRRGGRSAANDPGLNAVIDAKVDGTCLVGKTWDFHVKVALGIKNSETYLKLEILCFLEKSSLFSKTICLIASDICVFSP